jgi:hypothetical protein
LSHFSYSSLFFPATVWLAFGCSLVTDTADYREVSLSGAIDQLRPGCSGCLRQYCDDSYLRCEASAACTDHVACRSREPTPAGYWSCGGLGADTSFKELLSCQACSEACKVGTSLECTGRYAWKPLGTKTVHRRQRFIDNTSNSAGAPLDKLVFRVCRGQGVKCGPAPGSDPLAEPVADVETDLDSWVRVPANEGGWADLELPVEPGAGGFTGYFVVSGPDIPTYRIHHTNPLPAGDDEAQLFSNASLLELLFSAGACQAAAATGNLSEQATVLFQVTDCLRQPARGVSLRVLQAPSLIPLYTSGARGECPVTTGTLAEGNATGAILGIDPTLLHASIDFIAQGRLLSSAVVTLAAGQLTVIQGAPSPSSEVAPWSE